MVFTAPAKINLYLAVIRRREDGYHDIETFFERVSLADEIEIEEKDPPDALTCDIPDVPTGPDSLLCRTLLAFTGRARIKKSYHIRLKKNIPVSAGLGGGSSDAATLLMGLNEMNGRPLSEPDLHEIGRGLGSDVPFFLTGANFAVGRGRGDELEPVDGTREMWHVLVNPPLRISTARAYSNLPAFGLTKEGGVDRMVSAFLCGKGPRSLVSYLHNDLQAIALRDFPVLKNVSAEMARTGASGTLLSGSGPTVFGIFDSEEQCAAAVGRLRGIFPGEEGWRIFAVKTF